MQNIRFGLFIALLSFVTLGCSGEETPKGKDLEDLQNKAQQQVDEEERAHQKQQSQAASDAPPSKESPKKN
jgi:hypothetical protein